MRRGRCTPLPGWGATDADPLLRHAGGGNSPCACRPPVPMSLRAGVPATPSRCAPSLQGWYRVPRVLPQPQVGSSTSSKTYQLGAHRVAGQQCHPKCHLHPSAQSASAWTCANSGGQRPSSEAVGRAAGAQATLCSSPLSPHGRQHTQLCPPWPTAELFCSPHPGPLGAPQLGNVWPPPAAAPCPPGSHLSTGTGKALRERSGLTLQRSTLDFILPSSASPTPSQTASLFPGFAPCQVNTAGVSSPHAHH